MTQAPRRPYGFWGSTLWVAAATVVSTVAALIASWVYATAVGDRTAFPPGEYISILICLVIVAVLALAAKRTQWPLSDYFALVPAPRRYVVIAVAGGLISPFIVQGVAWLLGDADANSKALVDAYRATQKAGLLPILWLNLILVAPITEEIVFRGFLLPSWALSRLGSIGAIVATTVLFAAVHIQYDWHGMAAIAVAGLFYGWLRWRSGSLLPSIIAHVGGNALVTAAISLDLPRPA